MRRSSRKRFEEYLEAVHVLEMRDGAARLRDLSRMLGVRPASAEEYLSKLVARGFVAREGRGLFKLTEKGRRIAEEVYSRHTAIMEFLKTVLMLPPEIAEEDACYIEHGVHEETMERIRLFLDFIKKHLERRGFIGFLDKLRYYYEHGSLPPECVECMEKGEGK